MTEQNIVRADQVNRAAKQGDGILGHNHPKADCCQCRGRQTLPLVFSTLVSRDRTLT
jgi:hypothetical protein